MLADRYPQHPLAGAALVWLVQYNSSGEAAWRNRRTDRLVAQQIDTVAPPEADEKAGSHKGQRIGTSLAQASEQHAADQYLRRIGPPRPIWPRSGRNKQLLWPRSWPELDAAALVAEPRVGFPLAIAHRRQGYPRQAERFYSSLVRTACSRCLVGRRQERRLAPLAAGLATQTRDRLSADRRETSAGSASSTTRCGRRLARSSCTAPGRRRGLVGRGDAGLRQRVFVSGRQLPAGRGDSAGGDRKESAARCGVGHAGSDQFLHQSGSRLDDVLPSLGGSARLYPRRMLARRDLESALVAVAADRQDDTCKLEAAVPLVELTGEAPTAGQAWAWASCAYAPGVGVQSWSTPTAEPVGEGFGLLLFQ